MTTNETMLIISAMQTAFSTYKPADKKATIRLWTEMLADYSYEEISMALKVFIIGDTKGFAPSIGQLIDCIRKTKPKAYPDALEAWGKVSDAIRNSLYKASEEFNALPDLARKVIRNPRSLREWALLPPETVQSVIQSNFLRTYEKELKRQEEIDCLPKEIREGLQEKAPFVEHIEAKTEEEPKTYTWNDERSKKIEELRRAGIVG